MTLDRHTPLKPGKPLTRKTPMQRARTPKPRRARYTGATQTVKTDLATRAGGRCEVCGIRLTGDWSRHHRLPRRMGGTRRADVNELANLLLICGTATTGCHGRIESNREWAYVNGYLLPADATPDQSPVVYRGHLVLLADDGTITDQEPA